MKIKDCKFVCKKNDELEIEITGFGNEGQGVSHVDGYTLFVKGGLPGDYVRVKVLKTNKKFGYAKILDVLKPSEQRIEPICPVAPKCGGCQMQHCSYNEQLRFKEEKVANCLRRIAGLPVYTQNEGKTIYKLETPKKNAIIMEPILRMDKPIHYRNKAQFPVGYDKDGELVVGFYAGRTHSIIPTYECIVQHPVNSIILQTVLSFMKKYNISAYDEKINKGLVRHILIRVGKCESPEVMVCLVINGRKLPYRDKLVELLLENVEGVESVCLNINNKDTNVILGDEVITIYGKDYIEDIIGKIRFRISPLSFYQVNREQTKKLYETVLEYAGLKGNEIVWDLYCGIGTISLFLAQRAAKVYGVEIVPQAIDDARKNAKINGISNVEFFVGAAERVVPFQYESGGDKLCADVVTLDPPRKGCDEKLLKTVVNMKPDRIVYVSCNPATLARDLKYLCGNGYVLERVRACDMFGMSYHVESCVKLCRKW